MDITIREIRKRDFNAIHKLFYDAWYKDDWEYNNRELGHAYANWDINYSLNDSTFGRVAEVDGQVVGIILSRVGVQQKEMRRFQRHDSNDLIAFLKALDSERKWIIQEIEEERELSKRLINERKYGGEIVAFLVDQAFKRKGIGSLLYDSTIQHFSNFHLKDFYLLTDSNCDYQFYDKKGLTQAAAEEQNDGSIAYLYNYEFKKETT